MTLTIIKKRTTRIALPLLLAIIHMSNAYGQEANDYIEFNDRRNIVHGVYLGLSTYYGEIDNEDTYLFGVKLAYVANRQFEVGFVAVGFYSDQNIPSIAPDGKDGVIGGYGGLHVEPIFFGQKKVNLSFPVLIGSGAVSYIENIEDHIEDDGNFDEWDVAFVVEPGVSLLYNLSRYVQLELGAKYRFSSEVRLSPDAISDLNGFSAGFGVKIGVFNLGRNRYKKNIGNGE